MPATGPGARRNGACILPSAEAASAQTAPSAPALARRDFLLRAGAAAAGLALGPALVRVAAAREAGFLGWREVRPGVFATTNLQTGGNCMAVAGRDGALLVDTKFPVFARQITRDVMSLTGQRITRVVNTHHHGDHVGGNLEFVEKCPVIAHERAIPRVEDQHERNTQGITRGGRQSARAPDDVRDVLDEDLGRYREKLDDYGEDAWTPTVSVPTGTTGFEQGGVWVELVSLGLRAHTDNDLIVRIPSANVVHTGDLVFHGMFPFFDPEGGASAQGWMEALRRLEAMCDDETVVIAGHGEVTRVDGVRGQRLHIERLWEAVAVEVEKGTPVEDVKTMTWPFMDGLGFESLRERGNEFVYNEIKAG